MPDAPKKWTILIYFAGDNNLAEECVYALKEIKRTGTLNHGRAGQPLPAVIDVIAQFDPAGRANPTRRFKIRLAGGDGTLECDVIKELPETDTGYWRNLRDFLCETLDDEENRADYYMVILSGHAAAYSEGVFLQDEERPLSSIPSSFPIWNLQLVFGSRELKEALRGKKINILGFDACMMSTSEVCYELWTSELLELVMGSEGFTLNSGWPMDRIVAKLKEDPGLEPRELAKFIVNDYAKFYFDYHLGGLSSDLSIIDLTKVGDFRTCIDRLAGALICEFGPDPSPQDRFYNESGSPFQDAILLAHWAAQSYNGEQGVDLYDFCDLLQKRWDQDKTEGSVWFWCQRVKDVIKDHDSPLVLKCSFTGAAFQYSHGVSIYFPWGKDDKSKTYGKLAFAQYSDWSKFLDVYLQATQRRPRTKPSEFRATPPMNRGPAGRIFSMRNPPTAVPAPEELVPGDVRPDKMPGQKRRRVRR